MTDRASRGCASLALAMVATTIALGGCDGRSVGPGGPVRAGFYALAGTQVLHGDGSAGRFDPVHDDARSLNALAHGGGRVVVVGARGRVLVSAGDTAFATIDSPTTIDLLDVAHDGQRFVAVGYTWSDGGVMLLSDDGERWRVVPHSATRLVGVSCAGRRCFVTGAHLGDLPDMYLYEVVADSLKSVGRVHWGESTEQALVRKALGLATDALVAFNDGEVFPVLEPPAGTIRSVREVGSGYVALGERSRLLTSSDTRSWTAATVPGQSSLWFTAAAASPRTVVVSASAGRLLVGAPKLANWRALTVAGAKTTVRGVIYVR